MPAKANSAVLTVVEFRLATAWIAMVTYSLITTMDFATIESCSIRMLTMEIVTTITRFCGLICKFRTVIPDWMFDHYIGSFLTDYVFLEHILCILF